MVKFVEDFVLEYNYEDINPKVLIGTYAGRVIPNYRIHRSPPTLNDIDNLLRSSIISDTPIGKLSSIIVLLTMNGFLSQRYKT